MKWQPRSRAHAPGAAFYGVTDDQLKRWHERWITGTAFSDVFGEFRTYKRHRLRHYRPGDLINEWRRLGLELPTGKWRKMRSRLDEELQTIVRCSGLPRYAIMWAAIELALEREEEGRSIAVVLADVVREIVGQAQWDRKRLKLTSGGLINPTAKISEPRDFSRVRKSEPKPGYRRRKRRSLRPTQKGQEDA